MIFLAVLALATVEPSLTVAIAKTAHIAGACFQKITASSGFHLNFVLRRFKSTPRYCQNDTYFRSIGALRKRHDGIVQAWLDGNLVMDLDDIRFRDTQTLSIDGFYFSTFFGGSGDQWNTSKDEVAFFDDFKLTIPAPVLYGDVNRDDAIDFLDISPFISILAGGDYQDEADIDQSTEVNFLDIGPFINLLSGS